MDFIESSREEMLALWEKLVMTESGTENKAGCDEVAGILAQELEAAGASVRFEENETRGNVLYAEWGAENPGSPIVFTGHMDTVFPAGTTKERPFTIRNGLAYGPGVLDMKGGLTIAVYVLRALRAALWRERPIRVVFAGDEEGGHRQSDAAQTMMRLCSGAAAAFNFESGYMSDGIVVSRKGSTRFSFEVTGVEAHAGNFPEKGRSAIKEMAHKILELEELNDLENGTSVNVGVISGGTVVNAIPGYCRVGVDVRYTTWEHLDEVMEAAKRICEHNWTDGCTCRMTAQEAMMPMPQTEGNLALFRQVERAAERIGYGTVQPIISGGWSDSNLLASLGIPVVCAVGVRGQHNHTTREYAVVESLFERAKLIADTVLGLEL